MDPSQLWHLALVATRPDVSKEEQAFFALHLNAIREKAKALVSRIASDMPGYTIHDITHLDALWETASLVATEELALNPPEAFVFGGAVLLHDAAMTLAAYPGGLAELKKTTAWADAAALHGFGPTGASESSPAPPEVEAQIKTEVLRRLHAEKAAELATQGWRVRENDDERMYLIDDPDLRRFYGSSIGSVAHSHWWPIARVERDLARILGAMPPHTRHQVDLLKLAILLRVADALHLDRRRAPRFVRAFEQPHGFSALHWTAQERLAFPRIEDDAVVFTSGEPFELHDAEAWWLAYDAFVLADQELRDSDLLLASRNRGKSGLAARRVKGAGDPREMARHVPVVGWHPVETRVRVSEVPKLVETLGGAKLYGDHPTVPVRELLQNAMDAIQARRRLQGRASDWGTIVVELAERADGIWLSVEDTGVGMSEAVLVGPLIDFGSSFWRSPQVAGEYPGLAAKGMDAIGCFGIGFFSVFMLGEQVRVTTRRYDRAEDDALVLEFRTGLASRPILFPAPPGTAPLDGGTRVAVKLWADPRSTEGVRRVRLSSKKSEEDREEDRMQIPGALPSEFPSLATLVARLAPASEVSIDAIEFGQRTRAVSAGDWLVISATKLADRVSPEERWRGFETFMRPITTTVGTVRGRAALCPSTGAGALVAGGLRVTGVPDFLGVVPGEVATATRDEGRIVLPSETLSQWATEQVKLIESSDLDEPLKAICAELSLRHGGSALGLPLALYCGTWLSSDGLRRLIASKDQVRINVLDRFGMKQQRHLDRLRVIFIPHDGFVSSEMETTSHLRRLVLILLDQEWGGYDMIETRSGPLGGSLEMFRRPAQSSLKRKQ